MDVAVSGLKSAVGIGRILVAGQVEGGRGRIRVMVLGGEVILEGVSGDAEVLAGSGDVRVSDASGAVAIETIDGAVELEASPSRDVRVETVSGEVRWSGPMEHDGRYDLSTHSAGVTVGLPRDADATVNVRTHRGSITSSFGAGGARSKRASIVLGSGSAEGSPGVLLRLRRSPCLGREGAIKRHNRLSPARGGCGCHSARALLIAPRWGRGRYLRLGLRAALVPGRKARRDRRVAGGLHLLRSDLSMGVAHDLLSKHDARERSTGDVAEGSAPARHRRSRSSGRTW